RDGGGTACGDGARAGANGRENLSHRISAGWNPNHRSRKSVDVPVWSAVVLAGDASVRVGPGAKRAIRIAFRANRGPIARSRCRRSEEHTSELQSRFDLVCRLLLEK